MSLAAMVERKLNSPLSSEATLHHPVLDGTTDEHGDPDTTDDTTTLRCCIFPTEVDEEGDLGQAHFQAFLGPLPTIFPGDWLTVGDDRWDFVGPAKRWPTTGECAYQEAVVTRVA